VCIKKSDIFKFEFGFANTLLWTAKKAISVVEEQ